MAETQSAPTATWMRWTGYVISAPPILAFGMSASMKFMNSPELIKGMEHLGWPLKFMIALGITELTCTILYAIPQTSVVGAILITGYMGGAIATHARLGEAFVIQALVPILAWLGLYLARCTTAAAHPHSPVARADPYSNRPGVL